MRKYQVVVRNNEVVARNNEVVAWKNKIFATNKTQDVQSSKCVASKYCHVSI